MSNTLNRRQFVALASSGLAALGLSACGGTTQEAATEATTEAATEATTEAADQAADFGAGMEFIVGFDQEYPPYGYVADDGSFTGFDLELAQAVAEMYEWEYKAEPIDWDAKDALLNGGAITCIWNGFTLEGREDDYSFTEPYMLNAQVIVAKADAGIASFDDLAGKTVVTQVDSAALEVLEGDQAKLAATFAALEQRSDYNTAFMELESGAVDAVACDLSIAAFQSTAKPDAYAMLDEFLSEEHYAVGVQKGQDELADLITAALVKLDADGKVEALCEKYADQGISYANWCLEA